MESKLKMDDLSNRLVAAVKVQDFQPVKNLLGNGADVNILDTNRNLTPLQWCIEGCWVSDPKTNVVECVKLLVKAGADVNLKNRTRYRQSAVHMTATKNLPAVLMVLIDNGADVNTPNEDNKLPLHYICQYPETTESLKCFRRLIKDTSNINARTTHHFFSKETPFSIAVKAGNCQMVQELADSGCDINVCSIITAFEGNRPIANSKMVEKLIDLGCNVNARRGMTALMLAAETRDMESFKLLLKHGADVNARNIFGDSVIDCCLQYPHRYDETPEPAKDILEILLQSDSQINTVQLFEKHLGNVIESAVEYFIAKGFDIHHIGERDKNIFHFLARSRSRTLYEFDHLCDKVNINHKDANGITPLMVAVMGLGDVTSRIEYFLHSGADVNIVNKKGQTALMLCAEDSENSVSNILILLDAGSNPNTQDKNGRTVLQSEKLNLNSLKLFLQYGGAVSLDIKTEAGFTPLQYVLNTNRYSLFWHLLAENCSLVSLKASESKLLNPSQMVLNMCNKIVKLGKILYLCGASKQIIQTELRFKSNDETSFHGYCNKLSLKELCRRRLKRSIGAGIQQKLSEDSQIPRLLHDFIMLKDVFPAKVFDPNTIPDRVSRDMNLVLKMITLNDDDDNANNDGWCL